jgi:hypothetical protein
MRPLDTWDPRATAHRAHAIRWHCWIGVLSLEVLIIYQGKIIVALTYLFYFSFLNMHIVKLHLYIVGIDYLINFTFKR